MGDHVSVGTTWVITINTVTPSSGDSSYTPPSGKHLLIFDISQQNRTSQTMTTGGAADWSLSDSTGTVFQVVKTAYGELPVESVEAEATSRGELVYEVPVSVDHLTLKFAPLSGGDQAVWDISR